MKKMIRRLIASLAVLAVILSYAQIKNIAGDVFNEVKGYIPENVEDIDFDNLEASVESYASEQTSILVPSQRKTFESKSNRKYFDSGGIQYDAAPTSLDELLAAISPLMFYEKEKVILDMSNYPQQLTDIEDIQEWPCGGDWSNYTIIELFNPGSLCWSSEYDFFGDDEEETEWTEATIRGNHGTEVMQKCKTIASQVTGSTNQEKMASVIDILRSMSSYESGKYEPYDLLFNGRGNCSAYGTTVDCIARYLGIPCGEVSSDVMNHEWNIFIGSDGQIYEMDATNNIKPGLLGTTEVTNHYGSMDYQDTEIQLLNYDRKMLELHGNVQLPPPAEVTPTPTPEVPEDNPKPEETEPTPSPTEEEVTPTPAPEEVTPTPAPTEEPTEEKPVEEKPSEGNDGKPPVPSDAIPAPHPAPAETPTGSVIGTPVIASIDSGTGTMTVVTQPVSGCKYEIRYMREGSNWMSYKTNKDSFTSRGLRSGTTYYVQARLIKGNQYSDWTSSYSITIK